MLRILLAAVAGGIALQLWVLSSSLWLPPCAPAAPPPPVALVLPPPKPAATPNEPFVLVDTATPVVPDPTPTPDGLPPVPDRNNRAPVVLSQVVVSALWKNVGLAFSVGLVAALMAVALPLTTPLWRQWSLVLLVGLFAALIGRFNDLAAADKSPVILCACVVNHFGGVVIVASVAAAIARCQWLTPKLNYSRTS